MNTFDENETEVQQVIGLAAVAEHFEVSKTCLTNWVASGEFPRPIRIGRRLLRWRVAELNQWIENGCPRINE